MLTNFARVNGIIERVFWKDWIEVWSFMALIYLIMPLMSARAVNSIENRTKVSSR
jgi:ABC-type amino acid transport system permease subunit